MRNRVPTLSLSKKNQDFSRTLQDRQNVFPDQDLLVWNAKYFEIHQCISVSKCYAIAIHVVHIEPQ